MVGKPLIFFPKGGIFYSLIAKSFLEPQVEPVVFLIQIIRVANPKLATRIVFYSLFFIIIFILNLFNW